MSVLGIQQRLFAHPAAAMVWLGLGRAALRAGVDPAHPFGHEHPPAQVKPHKVSPQREFKTLSS